ncbi:MAG TPA: UDP-4-amino-4,6-dideoxy-N-acetyl-beta-L-altrosamine N-acetyltransferase [Caulobacteraceae bacterium]|jgi:UDP-4-amino-4,6-dideoxy-N-acetyl-beta-L-altrosamine N-acetyltransferase|nr:UDP-4-amino-4,6-dideoxy-N-acetyl-beta-L-altrosamine N-acetyltransferase [Caulobacteraceae bacterium]
MSVYLRRVKTTDGDRLLDWRNRPEVSAYMYTDHRISPQEHARWFAGALAAADRRYWIIELDAEPVGLANLAGIDLARRRCEWAYYLAESSVRGRGVGAAVEFAMLDHVFAGLGLHKLWCEVLIENEAVWKLHESFGFRREALYRDHVWKAGRFQDVVGLGLLAPDWAQARAACAERLAQKGHDAANLTLEAAP